MSLFGKAFFYGTILLNRPLSSALIRTFNNLRKQFLLNMMNKLIIKRGKTNDGGLRVEATGLFTTGFCLNSDGNSYLELKGKYFQLYFGFTLKQ